MEQGHLERATRGMKVKGGTREGNGGRDRGTWSPGKRMRDLAHRGRDRENDALCRIVVV